VVLEAAAFWSAGAVVVAGAVLLEAAAFWSVLLGVCAGGFTGALALSPAVPAGLLVVAAGAFALFASVVGVWLLPDAADGLLLAALWSVALAGAVVLVAAADEDAEESDGAALEA
jgi:subtilisin family serine protease